MACVTLQEPCKNRKHDRGQPDTHTGSKLLLHEHCASCSRLPTLTYLFTNTCLLENGNAEQDAAWILDYRETVCLYPTPVAGNSRLRSDGPDWLFSIDLFDLIVIKPAVRWLKVKLT